VGRVKVGNVLIVTGSIAIVISVVYLVTWGTLQIDTNQTIRRIILVACGTSFTGIGIYLLTGSRGKSR